MKSSPYRVKIPVALMRRKVPSAAEGFSGNPVEEGAAEGLVRRGDQDLCQRIVDQWMAAPAFQRAQSCGDQIEPILVRW
jgi:hypothetical protein